MRMELSMRTGPDTAQGLSRGPHRGYTEATLGAAQGLQRGLHRGYTGSRTDYTGDYTGGHTELSRSSRSCSGLRSGAKTN